MIVVWIAEGVWEAAVEAARTWAPDGTPVRFVAVVPEDVGQVWHGAAAGLFGRGRRPAPESDPELEQASRELLAEAAARFGREAETELRDGRVEREVVLASEGADLLIVSRDGNKERLGPHSLGPASRFVVDHAACPVLVVWPGDAPSAEHLPPPPRHP